MIRDNGFVRRSYGQQFRRQSIELGVAVIPDNKSLFPVEHA